MKVFDIIKLFFIFYNFYNVLIKNIQLSINVQLNVELSEVSCRVLINKYKLTIVIKGGNFFTFFTFLIFGKTFFLFWKVKSKLKLFKKVIKQINSIF